MFIEALYYGNATGDDNKAAVVFERYHDLYPRDSLPPAYLSLFYGDKGDYEKTANQAREVARLNPDNAIVYQNLAVSLKP